MLYIVLLLLFLTYCGKEIHASSLPDEQKGHTSIQLSNDQLIIISKLSNKTNFENVLDSILIPRVVGTPTHAKVKRFLIQSMEKLGWQVETDKFVENTPIFGPLEFENIIASLNENANRFLVLACHYDSKYFREGEFLGATDSAVPCAMMINLAYTLKKQLDDIKSNDNLSLKFIFFDGEEAFHRWGPDDSIYGARHLAKKWESTHYPNNKYSPSRRCCKDGTTELQKLDLLVLLDLLGAPDPVFYSYFPDTETWYRQIASAEERLAEVNQLKRYSNGKPEQRYFRLMSTQSGVEDDHIPFLLRGVPVLHLIPHRFPDVWHTYHDNRNAVDFTTVDNLNKILRVFVAEYLRLKV